MATVIEVELKFRVESLPEIRQRFLEMGAIEDSVVRQMDEYLNDPIRDFAKLDLALRIRNTDGEYCLTFKGPNLDADVKVRQEIEMPLDETGAGQMKAIFEGIGLRSVVTVIKRRETLVLDCDGVEVHVCLDDVERVGGFVELEIVVDGEPEILDAKRVLIELASRAGLGDPVRRSYIKMFLESIDSARGLDEESAGR